MPHRKRPYAAQLAGFLLALMLLVGCSTLPVTLPRLEGNPMRGVEADKTSVGIGERVTLSAPVRKLYQNPFDSGEVRLEAVVGTLIGGERVVPGFYHEPFKGLLVDGRESVLPRGTARWEARLAFASAGRYKVYLRLIERSGRARSNTVTITVNKGISTGAGYVSRSDDLPHFATEDGASGFLIGATASRTAPGPEGVFAYDRWFADHAAQGGQFARVWLGPQWATCALTTKDSGFDGIDQANAWRLDYVLNLTQQHGLKLVLCLDGFNTLCRERLVGGDYHNSPWAIENGGPLYNPSEFFRHPDALDASRDRLRYIVARYGYSPAVFAWEFWNAVDLTTGYDAKTVQLWHEQMSSYLRSLDPWGHLITTSLAAPGGQSEIEGLRHIDFVQTAAGRMCDALE